MKILNYAVIILLIISLWMNFTLSNRVEQLANDLSYLKYNLPDRINAISSSVHNALNDMKEQAKWIRDCSYQVVSMADDYSQFDIKLDFSLNEQKASEKLYIVVIDENSRDKQQIAVPIEESLNYTVTIPLKSCNYSLNLLGSTPSGSRIEPLKSVILLNIKNNLVMIEGRKVREYYTSSSKTGYINFFVGLSSKPRKAIPGMENLQSNIEFVSVDADVYMGLEKLDTFDLMSGEGYTPISIEDVTNEYPEYLNEFDYIFSGSYIINTDIYQKYMEFKQDDLHDEAEIYFLIKATDTKGNEYKTIVDHSFYYLDGDTIKSYR